MRTPEEILEDNGYEIEELKDCETILFRNPDYSTAIIGVSDDNRIIYDFDKMIEFLIENENMNYEEASDFISYNTIRSLPYIKGNRPIIMNALLETN